MNRFSNFNHGKTAEQVQINAQRKTCNPTKKAGAMMLGRAGTAYAKKASKFEDSDSSNVSRPRAMSELPHRPAPRVPTRPRTATMGSELSGTGARHRGLGVGRGTAPRSPLHEKKPAAAGPGGGAGSRVAELEAKLGKAHDQLAEMREQLAAAEKARKDARGAFDEAKKRFATKQGDVATSAPALDNDDDHAPAERKQHAESATDDHVTNGGDHETRVMSSPATGVLEPILPESENNRDQVDEQVKKAGDVDDEVNNNVALFADGDDGKRGNPEADQLRTKLEAKDRKVYEVRAKLMVRDIEVDELRVELVARDTAVEELILKLVAKDAEIAALIADNTALVMTASEAAEAARETNAAKTREIEHALRESAAREAQVAERLAASERAREALETEARRSRVQSEQWRKAAEEAAAVLGGAPGNKDMQRHGSVGSNGRELDKQDVDGGGSGGKRKSGAAVRLLADLWKKKVPK